MAQLEIKVGTWDKLNSDAMAIRYEVFIVEQSVPEDIERDDMDAVSMHAVAYSDDGQPIGTGRLLPDGHVGRMAVLRQARGTGIGGQILDALLKKAQSLGHKHVALHAQVHARGFYEAHGFQAEGDTFIEAGINHVLMVRHF